MGLRIVRRSRLSALGCAVGDGARQAKGAIATSLLKGQVADVRRALGKAAEAGYLALGGGDGGRWEHSQALL